MAMMAVAAGAKGLTWYSWYYGIREDSAHHRDVFAIGKELRALEPFVLAPEAPAQIRPQADEHSQSLVCLTKQVPTERSEEWVLLAVNVEEEPLEGVRFPLPDDMPPLAEVIAWFDGSAPTVVEGVLVDHFGPYEAKAYSLRVR